MKEDIVRTMFMAPQPNSFRLLASRIPAPRSQLSRPLDASTGSFVPGTYACPESEVVTQAMRSHEFMSSMVPRTSAAGLEKWEYFWMLKHMWADRIALARAMTPLACARWTLYRTDRHRFPLCDSPVMINRDNVKMTLSPRLLAEIDLTVQAPEDKWIVRDGTRQDMRI